MCLYVLGGRGCYWPLVYQLRLETRPRGGGGFREGVGRGESLWGEGSYCSNQTPKAPRPLPHYINAAASLRSSLPLKSLTATPSLHRAEERPREGQQLLWVAQQRQDWNPGLLPVVSAGHAAWASQSSSSRGSSSTFFSLPGLQDVYIYIYICPK